MNWRQQKQLLQHKCTELALLYHLRFLGGRPEVRGANEPWVLQQVLRRLRGRLRAIHVQSGRSHLPQQQQREYNTIAVQLTRRRAAEAVERCSRSRRHVAGGHGAYSDAHIERVPIGQ